MARRKAKKSSSGILIIFAVLFSIVTALPKGVWIAIGIITCIGVVLWLLVKLTKQKKDQIPVAVVVSPSRQESKVPTMSSSMPKRSTSEVGVENASEFYTFQLGSSSSTTFGISNTGTQKPDARWVPAGEPVTVAGFSIPDGMLYLGTALGGRYDEQEPSLINPKLRIAKQYVDIENRLMPYWPSFHSITPEARRGYLQWLAGGRNDPLADLGYVFLFFYGLERRLLVDAANDPQVNAETSLLVTEIQRLLSIYGENRSFRGYAEGFLEYLRSTTVDPNTALFPKSMRFEWN